MNTITQRVMKNGKVLGWLAASCLRNGVSIGWSKVHKFDQYDPILGKDIAINRTFGTNSQLPHSFKKPVEIFRKRCTRYFKDQPIN